MKMFPQSGFIRNRCLKRSLKGGASSWPGHPGFVPLLNVFQSFAKRQRQGTFAIEIHPRPRSIMPRATDKYSTSNLQMIDRKRKAWTRRKTDVRHRTAHHSQRVDDRRQDCRRRPRSTGRAAMADGAAFGQLLTPHPVGQSAARPARVNWQTPPQSFRQWLASDR